MAFDSFDLSDVYETGVEGSISIDGCDISVVEFNPSGEVERTIIGIPGGPGLPKEHLLPLSVLTDIGYRVVVYDTHNVGNSDEHSDPYMFDTFVKILDGIVSEYDNPVLAGNSWGAILSFEYLIDYESEDVSGLVALAPVFDSQEGVLTAKAIRSVILSYEETEYMHECENNNDFEGDSKYSFLSDRFDSLCGFVPPVPSYLQDVLEDKFNETMYREMWGPEEFVLNDEGTLKDWSVKNRLEEIDVPTLLVTGENDMFGYHHLFDGASLIGNNSEFVVIRNASHSFIWEKPFHSMTTVAEWLKSKQFE